MICLICRKAEIAERLTSVNFERGEFRLVVRGVPARLCPSCGEGYVEETVAARLLQIAQDASMTGALDAFEEYQPA